MYRQRLIARGIVQGVGFRPFVHRLAHALGLAGWVRNDASGVTLEVQGESSVLDEFRLRLENEAPSAARIDAIEAEAIAAEGDASSFEILFSETTGEAKGQMKAVIGPDLCTCPACLAELFDPANRRYRYAFTNCTACGPRYTIAHGLPYDRARTSMAAFALCAHCRAEYEAPADRRFHAEPNACPACGPQLALRDAAGHAMAGDPIGAALAVLQRGGILALKGLGGFHLACDARNAAAVARLRQRKQREEMPFAVMAANTASLAGLAQVTAHEARWLDAPERPIVLVRKAGEALAGVADGLGWLGVMRPYTPLHWLLFHEAAGRPDGLAWCDAAQALLLVMTSANPHGEPLVTHNDEALRTLGGIADAFLMHEREIVIRCDDSVLRVQREGQAQFVRRSRGFTPAGLPLAGRGPDVLALGGFYKATLCFTRGEQAFLSQHIGDLDRLANCEALEAAVAHLGALLQVQPQALAHDLHPDFFSTRLAQQLAEARGLPCVAVQHHHAHIAAVLAEHGVEEPVLGLALDGVGLGHDGAAWGGELLRVEGAACTRLGHLRPLALPGGDAAAREPWRMGAAALHQLGRGEEIATRFAGQAQAPRLAQWLARGVAQTTSLGRYFDAAAGLLGVQPQMSFEAQAAMRLEALAASAGLPRAQGRFALDGGVLDLAPLLQTLAGAGTAPMDARQGAALFHAELIAALAEWVGAAAESSGLRTVAGGGGCWLNALLAEGLIEACAQRGLRLLLPAQVPPGDGGLALGQAWVARRALAQ